MNIYQRIRQLSASASIEQEVSNADKIPNHLQFEEYRQRRGIIFAIAHEENTHFVCQNYELLIIIIIFNEI